MSRKNLFRTIITTFILTTLMTMSVCAAQFEYVGNIFSAGDDPTVENMTGQDIFAAGSTVEVTGSLAKGNIFAAGNIVNVTDSSAGADVTVAGQKLKLSDVCVDGNVIAAGSSVDMYNVETGSIIAAAETVTFEGVTVDANISGNKVIFNGYAQGDVDIEAESVEIGENAIIGGNLNIVAAKEPVINDGANISNYVYEEKPNDVAKTAKTLGLFARMLKKLASSLYWMVAMALVGLVMCFLFKNSLNDAKEVIVNKTVEVLLEGLGGWIGIPVVAFFLAISIIGLPLSGLLMLVYVTLVCVGLAFAGASLGRLVFPKLHPVLASVIGIAILELVRIVPFVGGLVAIVADIYLIGYVIYKIKENYINSKPNVVTAVALDEPPVFTMKDE